MTTETAKVSTPQKAHLIWQSQLKAVRKFVGNLNKATKQLPLYSEDQCEGNPARFRYLQGLYCDISYDLEREEIEQILDYGADVSDTIVCLELESYLECNICGLPYRIG